MDKNILHCTECNKVFKKTDYDKVPMFIFDKNLDDFVPIPRDDMADFSKAHRGHHVQGLTVLENTSYSRMPYHNKKELGYFEATDGKRMLLIKKWRSNINEPLNYKIIKNGQLRVRNVKVTPQVDLIKAQLAKQFLWIEQKDIDRFIEVVEPVVAKMDLEKIEECFWDTGDSMIVLAKLSFREIREIIRECQKFLTWTELKAIRDFIEENNRDNGVMTVRLQKKMWVEKFNLRGIKSKRNMLCHNEILSRGQ